MRLALTATLAMMLTMAGPTARAQDADEVAKLRTENELLKKENELLKKEIELLKKEAAAKPDGTRKARPRPPSLSDLLPAGTVLQGTFRAAEGGGHGEITITITSRDGNKFKADSALRQMRDFKELGRSEGPIEGTISGPRLTWTNIGSANKANATVILKGEALEGTYRTQAGIFGTVGLRIMK